MATTATDRVIVTGEHESRGKIGRVIDTVPSGTIVRLDYGKVIVVTEQDSLRYVALRRRTKIGA